MILPALFFYLFAAVCVASAVMVIVSKNPVHSVLYLILAFVNASGLFVLMGAEFLAMILVVVYVGAVAVLFLFVVGSILIYAVKTIVVARRTPQRSDRETPYVALQPHQMADL